MSAGAPCGERPERPHAQTDEDEGTIPVSGAILPSGQLAQCLIGCAARLNDVLPLNRCCIWTVSRPAAVIWFTSVGWALRLSVWSLPYCAPLCLGGGASYRGVSHAVFSISATRIRIHCKSAHVVHGTIACRNRT